MRSHKRLSLCLLLVMVCFSHGQEDYAEVAPMEKSEMDSLFSTIRGFVGSWWNGSDLYPDPCGWTPIQGVTCDIFDGLWYVTALNIGPTHDNSLACAQHVEFKPGLFELKHLATLTFYSCFTAKPVTISSLSWSRLSSSLRTLEFRSNPGLTGHVPPAFESLRKLESLVLVENGLSGEIPRNVGNLSRLKRLSLAGNKLNGTVPESVGRLSELLILDLSRNMLSGTLPVGLGSLSSLLKLDLSYNQLSGTLLEQLGGLKNLTLLDLSSNRLSGGLARSLQSMDSLEELVLSNNPIAGELRFMDWEKMGQLVILDLASMGFSGPVPESMSELTRLRFLGLNDNNLSGSLSPKLAALPSLTAFYIHGNNLTGDLTFSGHFYLKMGRRFGAWRNPNLCYSAQRLASTDAPFGVKPCRPY
uniref:Disease resistance R13L4/SHOC-2-like LRR domain-containing protein n=1 Tax=Kalanchoe fedtschenkoi TaxID=63787 RepID=A0A7N0ZYW7_KALFE